MLQFDFMVDPKAANRGDTTGRLQGLQILRGLAALLVMWSHIKYNLGVPSSEFASKPWLATNIGAIGVDIFFVISGFVISMTAARLGENWRAFLVSRISRVVPLYFLISGFLLAAIVGGFTEFGNWVQGFSQLFNTFEFIPLFDHATFTNPLCGNGWTLSFEMWFYLLFAGVMSRVGPRAGTIMPVLMSVGVFATATLYHSQSWYLPKFLFHPMTLEFCAGCLLYQFRHRIESGALWTMCLLLPVFLFWSNHEQALGLHNHVLNNTGLGFLRATAWGGFSFCLVGIVTQLDLRHRLNWPSFLLLTGDASYSIYLIAPLVMPICNIMLHVSHVSNLTPLLNGSIYVSGTIVGGFLLWKYVEVPAANWAQKKLAISRGESSMANRKSFVPSFLSRLFIKMP